jgi:hypothetical protein
MSVAETAMSSDAPDEDEEDEGNERRRSGGGGGCGDGDSAGVERVRRGRNTMYEVDDDGEPLPTIAAIDEDDRGGGAVRRFKAYRTGAVSGAAPGVATAGAGAMLGAAGSGAVATNGGGGVEVRAGTGVRTGAATSGGGGVEVVAAAKRRAAAVETELAARIDAVLTVRDHMRFRTLEP